MVLSRTFNSWNVRHLCSIIVKDILLLFYSTAFCDLAIERQLGNLSTSQAYGYEVVRQMLDFLRCN